jgi:hypothetical protein
VQLEESFAVAEKTYLAHSGLKISYQVSAPVDDHQL